MDPAKASASASGTISAVVRRADGSVEDLGVVGTVEMTPAQLDKLMDDPMLTDPRKESP